MFRLAAILLSSLWISGCFISEEIRKGDALIEQHSVGWREKQKGVKQAEEESAKAEAETESRRARSTGPGVKDKFSDWWRETVDEEPVKTNPDDKLVSCEIGGKLRLSKERVRQLKDRALQRLRSGQQRTRRLEAHLN